MFDVNTYASRRAALCAALGDGIALLPGSDPAPMNFAANTYPFVQDSNFRYFFGLDRPGLFGLLDLATGEAILFGDQPQPDDLIWTGEARDLDADARRAGIGKVEPRGSVTRHVERARRQGRVVHFLPAYKADILLRLADALDVAPQVIRLGASSRLIQAIVSLREIKSPGEIAEMEAALELTRDVHHLAMRETRPGRFERQIVGAMEGLVRGAGRRLAYGCVFTARGEILHNRNHDGLLTAGDLVINDAGTASAGGYSAAITRSLPASGRFDPLQRALYELVLSAQVTAIAACRPGEPFSEIHRRASLVLVEGLTTLGVFRGDAGDIVESGAYAICYQSGLGHQIGLDVRDMESLGEDHVGYDAEVRRRDLFGWSNLRMARRLKPGMTVTVGPGIFFIEALIQRWRAEGRFAGLIDYDALSALGGVRGVRVEDNLLVTDMGCRILGPPVARSIAAVEALMADR